MSTRINGEGGRDERNKVLDNKCSDASTIVASSCFKMFDYLMAICNYSLLSAIWVHPDFLKHWSTCWKKIKWLTILTIVENNSMKNYFIADSKLRLWCFLRREIYFGRVFLDPNRNLQNICAMEMDFVLLPGWERFTTSEQKCPYKVSTFSKKLFVFISPTWLNRSVLPFQQILIIS